MNNPSCDTWDDANGTCPGGALPEKCNMPPINHADFEKIVQQPVTGARQAPAA